MNDKNKAHALICQNKPWANIDNNIWIASTVSLSRNIEKFKFPGKLSEDRKKQIITLIDKDPFKLDGLEKPKLIKADEITPIEKEYLSEHFLTQHGFLQTGSGDGFILDETGEFLGVLNLVDHLFFLLIDWHGELESAWERLVKIEMEMGKTFKYSFSTKYGFLTAEPTECGTAMLASVFLQVPGMIHIGTIDEFLEKNADDSISVTGIHGSPTDVIGDVLVIQNNYTLGVTEESILSSLRTITHKILAEETAVRLQIKKNGNPEIKDKVSRAYAILSHSYQIEAIEALNAISLLKLGLEMEWITGVTMADLNRLFFNCRRGHLLNQFQEAIPQEEILHRRAEYIHKTFKDLKLVIL